MPISPPILTPTDIAFARRIRRHLHRSPEIGLHMPQTTRFLWEELEKLGLPPALCGKSITARLGSGSPVLLLRADMDALPMQEESGEPFASQGGCAHSCGHDLHAAMLLTAARMLKTVERDLRGSVIFLFQPGEETFEGARDALENGLIARFSPDFALALHVAAGKMPPGALFYNAGGVMMHAADTFRIEIIGKGGHGAYPDRAVDPIAIGVAIHAALRQEADREREPCLLTVGTFHAGEAANSIPALTVLSGTLRSGGEAVRERMVGALPRLAAEIAAQAGGEARVTVSSPVPPLICDKAWTEEAVGYLRGMPGLTLHPGMCAAASEDFALIAQRVPSAMLYLSAGFEDERGRYTAHDPRVRFHEDVMPIGAEVLLRIVCEKLGDAGGV